MAQRSLDICLSTADFVGPIRNGGIGTAYHAMAMALRDAGHRVTVLYGLGDWCERGKIGDWVEHYRKQNISFVPVPSSREPLAVSTLYLRFSYETYLWLAEQERSGRRFDVIHMHEWRGLGFYSVLAKQQGLNFGQSVLCIGTHSPEMWHRWGMKQHPSTIEDLQADFLERTSVRYADVVVSPSQYMLDWMREEQWKFPADTQVRQNLLTSYLSAEELAAMGPRNVSDVVFFGRLETRKGLPLFCDALDQIVADTQFFAARADFNVTFLGKKTSVEGIASGEYLEHRAKAWPFAWRVIDHLDHAGALDYLNHPSRMAVMPSVLENSPYTLLECLANGIPCLCTDLPGNRELIHAADAANVTFVPRPKDLANKIKQAVAVGIKPAAPAIHPERNKADWILWHEQIAGTRPGPAAPAQKPLVSVCLVHRNRPTMLAQALQSLRAQDYPNVQVVLVDDGSDQPDALEFLAGLESEFARKRWKIIRQENRYLGAARNTGAKASDGEWLLFMDDDNYAMPHEISTFVRAALSAGADVMTCLSACFQETQPPEPGITPCEIWLPLGGAIAVGAFLNLYGDANGIIRRDLFEKLGGFTEDYGAGHEDWELYAKAALAGYTVMIVPQPLFWYRVHRTSMLRTTSHFVNHMRSLRPYLKAMGPDLSQILLFAQGLFFGQQQGMLPAPPASSPSTAPSPSGAGTVDNANPPTSAPGGVPAFLASRDIADPQRLVDEYWDSLSWRLSGVVRAAMSKVMNAPTPLKPRVATHRDAMVVIDAIRRSISWEVTGPLRAVGRTLQVFKVKRNGSTSMGNHQSNGNSAD
ncbi:MAG: glycosyltransferase [Planctomycetota bacterium]|nr:glycosyltransferase [Planctomycetota bacterium]